MGKSSKIVRYVAANPAVLDERINYSRELRGNIMFGDLKQRTEAERLLNRQGIKTYRNLADYVVEHGGIGSIPRVGCTKEGMILRHLESKGITFE